MAKIRALKPEFFTDEKVVEVSPLARLLYQGMWVRTRIGVLEKAGPAGNRTLTARPQPIRPGGNGL